MVSTSLNANESYALIAGHGRSGTNWLLHLLDRASATHCRNEPNEIAGNAFAALPSPFVPVADAGAFAAPWSRAVAEASRRMGDRDRAAAARKTHLAAWAQQTGLCDALTRPRRRRLLSLAVPTWRGAEWPIPGLRAGASAPLAVLKCNQVPGWARYVLEHDAELGRVVHIVRHPGGFLRSWRQRYVALRDVEQVLRESRARLALVARADTAFAEIMGDPASHDLNASELWYWRYAIETIDAAGQGSGAYRRIVFEELAADPVAGARELFTWLGLEWNSDVESEIFSLSSDSGRIAKRWTEEVDADERACIERVMSGSVLETWWK